MYRIKIQGNFFLILNNSDLSEKTRHPKEDTQFQAYNDLDSNPTFSFSGKEATFNDKSNEEVKYSYSQLIDDRTGSLFTDKDELIKFLSDNIGGDESIGSSTDAPKGNKLSTENSTDLLLGANETFTGEWEDVTNYTSVGVAVLTENVTVGILYFDISMDGGVNFISIPRLVANSTFNLPRLINIIETHVRIRYDNGAAAQTGFFRLQTTFANGRNLGLTFPVNGTINSENDVTLVKSVIAGEILDGLLNPTGIYGNVSLLQNGALKTASPSTVLFEAIRPVDPVIPSGNAITIDPVLNTEPNVLDSGWIASRSFPGGSSVVVNSDTSLRVYLMNASDNQGNNLEGESAPFVISISGEPAVIGADFFGKYFRILIENVSGSDATEYSITAKGNQTPATPVFSSLSQQIFDQFPAPLNRSVLSGKAFDKSYHNIAAVETSNDSGTYYSLQVVSGARPSQLPGRTPVNIVSDTGSDSLQYTVSANKTLYVTDIVMTIENLTSNSPGLFYIEDGLVTGGVLKLPVRVDEPSNTTTGLVVVQHTFVEPIIFNTGVFFTQEASNLNMSGVINGYEE